MKKSLVCLAALCALGAARAEDSSITVYGIVDLAVGHVAHSLSTDPNFPFQVNPISPNNNPSGVNGMFNGGISDSRLGFRGVEDLGGGKTAFFTLESGFNANDGAINSAGGSLASNSPTKSTVSANSSLNGQFFSRQSFVGLSDPKMGSIAFGRQYNPVFDVVSVYDPVQAADLFSPLGFSGTWGGGGGVSESTRLDNTIKYKNNFSGVNFSALYKIGGVANNAAAGSGWATNLGYETSTFGVQAVYEQFTDALKLTNSNVAGEVGASVYDTTAYLLAARYKGAGYNLKAGYQSYTLKTPSNVNTLSTMGLSTFGFATASITPGIKPGAPNQTTDVMWFGGDYNITGTTNLSAAFYDLKNGAGQPDGNIYAYSMLLDHNLSKRTDVYSGLMFAQYKGAAYAAPTNGSNSIFAVGVRHRF